jgi:hypothetical protein
MKYQELKDSYSEAIKSLNNDFSNNKDSLINLKEDFKKIDNETKANNNDIIIQIRSKTKSSSVEEILKEIEEVTGEKYEEANVYLSKILNEKKEFESDLQKERREYDSLRNERVSLTELKNNKKEEVEEIETRNPRIYTLSFEVDRRYAGSILNKTEKELKEIKESSSLRRFFNSDLEMDKNTIDLFLKYLSECEDFSSEELFTNKNNLLQLIKDKHSEVLIKQEEAYIFEDRELKKESEISKKEFELAKMKEKAVFFEEDEILNNVVAKIMNEPENKLNNFFKEYTKIDLKDNFKSNIAKKAVLSKVIANIESDQEMIEEKEYKLSRTYNKLSRLSSSKLDREIEIENVSQEDLQEVKINLDKLSSFTKERSEGYKNASERYNKISNEKFESSTDLVLFLGANSIMNILDSESSVFSEMSGYESNIDMDSITSSLNSEISNSLSSSFGGLGSFGGDSGC